VISRIGDKTDRAVSQGHSQGGGSTPSLIASLSEKREWHLWPAGSPTPAGRDVKNMYGQSSSEHADGDEDIDGDGKLDLSDFVRVTRILA